MLVKIESSQYLNGYAEFTGGELEMFVKLIAKICKVSNKHLDVAYLVDTGTHVDATCQVLTTTPKFIAIADYEAKKVAFKLGQQMERAVFVRKMLADPDDRDSDSKFFSTLENHSVLYSQECETAYVFGGTTDAVELRGTGYNGRAFALTVKADGTYTMTQD